MIIEQPYLRTNQAGVSVCAKVQVETSRHLSRELWFEVNDSNGQYLMASFDPFVVGVLMLAMSLGEDIKINGNLSPKLIYGLKQYQQYFHYWFKDRLQVVDIVASAGEEMDGDHRQEAVASFFSGGVDSFYTLWSHLPEQERVVANRLTHCVFVHGFDIPINDVRTFDTAFVHYEKMMERMGIQLIGVRTNLKELLIHCNVGWGMTHGTALGAVGMLWQGLVGRMYIPSTQKYSVAEPWGSNPVVDPMLSLNQLDFVHHGAHMARLDKITEICHWPVVYDAMRVCWLRPNGINNCGRCEKCLRTMMALEIEGTLRCFSTFPSKRVVNWSKWKVVDYYEKGYLEELKERAEQRKRFDLLAIMEKIQQRSKWLRGAYWLRKELWYKGGYMFLRVRDYWRQLVVKTLKGKDY